MSIFDDMFKMIQWPYKVIGKPRTIEWSGAHGTLFWEEREWQKAIKYFRDHFSVKPEGKGWKRTVNLWEEGDRKYLGIEKVELKE